MRPEEKVPPPENEAGQGSTESAPAAMYNPCASQQDIDFLAAESEALEAAGVPWPWRDALRRTVITSPEEGAPCPGGFGVGV